jgi:23S rRNA (adenine2030-N6)-methyltransferase
MLSYRHEFHAGNAADVLKHAVLVFCLRYMQQKEGGMLLLDTHAGAGAYDLGSAKAQKTGEFHGGIEKLLAAKGPLPALLAEYLELIRTDANYAACRRYPGSPVLAAALLRRQDRAVLCELHPSDHSVLSGWARGQRGVTVRREDGFAVFRSLIPPRERRALVLIDPSYEVKTDYELVVAAVTDAWRRFQGGVYALWYPVVDRPRIDAMEAAFRAGPVKKVFRVEFATRPDTQARGMTASGIVVINPPFTLPGACDEALPWLADALGATGVQKSGWIVPE